MASDKPALVLLHGIGMTADLAWQEVVPLLSEHHQVFAPTALGHRGGPPAQRRPVTVTDVIDAAEHYLDEHGLHRPHLAGNSLGGYMAIELARRGRAASVCALSPGGFWAEGDGLQPHIAKGVRRNLAMARVARPVVPLLCKSARVRRLAMRDSACNGDRLTAARFLQTVDDALACSAMTEILGQPWQVAPLDPLPCPITVAWSGKDAILPVDQYQANVRERLPQAVFKVLPDVGHIPAFDDPHLVARTILDTTQRSQTHDVP